MITIERKVHFGQRRRSKKEIRQGVAAYAAPVGRVPRVSRLYGPGYPTRPVNPRRRYGRSGGSSPARACDAGQTDANHESAVPRAGCARSSSVSAGNRAGARCIHGEATSPNRCYAELEQAKATMGAGAGKSYQTPPARLKHEFSPNDGFTSVSSGDPQSQLFALPRLRKDSVGTPAVFDREWATRILARSLHEEFAEPFKSRSFQVVPQYRNHAGIGRCVFVNQTPFGTTLDKLHHCLVLLWQATHAPRRKGVGVPTTPILRRKLSTRQGQNQYL